MFMTQDVGMQQGRHGLLLTAAAPNRPVVDDDALELGEERPQAAPLAQGRPVHVPRLRALPSGHGRLTNFCNPNIM